MQMVVTVSQRSQYLNLAIQSQRRFFMILMTFVDVHFLSTCDVLDMTSMAIHGTEDILTHTRRGLNCSSGAFGVSIYLCVCVTSSFVYNPASQTPSSLITSKCPAKLHLRAKIFPARNSAPTLRPRHFTLIDIHATLVKPRLGPQTVAAIFPHKLQTIFLRRIMLVELHSRNRR